MKLGISSHTFPWATGVPGYPAPPLPLSALDLLDKAARWELGVVQIADNLPLHALSDRDVDAIAARARELHIELELGTCGIEPKHLRSCLALAVRLRSRILRVVIDTADRHPSPADVVSILRPLLPQFESAGVSLALENHDRFRARTLEHLFEQLQSPAVGLCLDTANSIGCEERLDTLVDALGEYVINLHVKDYRIARLPHGKGFVVEGCPAGTGCLDVAWLLGALPPREGVNAIVELWPPPAATLEASIEREHCWAEESVRYLRRFVRN